MSVAPALLEDVGLSERAPTVLMLRGPGPDPLEVCLDGVHPLLPEVIDPPGALRLLCDEAGSLQQPQVSRDSRAADRQGSGNLLDRLVAVSEQAKDRPPVGVAEGRERVTASRRLSPPATPAVPFVTSRLP